MAGTAGNIAAVNTVEAHRDPRSEGAEPEPSGGIVSVDTFRLSTLRDGARKLLLPDNGERAECEDIPVKVRCRPFRCGNQRTHGEYSRPEGRVAFGRGSRALQMPDCRDRVANEPKSGR